MLNDIVIDEFHSLIVLLINIKGTDYLRCPMMFAIYRIDNVDEAFLVYIKKIAIPYDIAKSSVSRVLINAFGFVVSAAI